MIPPGRYRIRVLAETPLVFVVLSGPLDGQHYRGDLVYEDDVVQMTRGFEYVVECEETEREGTRIRAALPDYENPLHE